MTRKFTDHETKQKRKKGKDKAKEHFERNGKHTSKHIRAREAATVAKEKKVDGKS